MPSSAPLPLSSVSQPRPTQARRYVHRANDFLVASVDMPPMAPQFRAARPNVARVTDAFDNASRGLSQLWCKAWQPLLGSVRVDARPAGPRSAQAALWHSLCKHGLLGSVAKMAIGERAVHAMDLVRLAVVAAPAVTLGIYGGLAGAAVVGTAVLLGAAVGMQAPRELAPPAVPAVDADTLYSEAEAVRTPSVAGTPATEPLHVPDRPPVPPARRAASEPGVAPRRQGRAPTA